MKVNPVLGGVMALLFATLIFTIVAVATPVWVVNNNLSWGLFRYCYKGNCWDRPTQTLAAHTKASGAFGVMAILAQISSLFCFGFCFYKNKMPLKAAGCALTVIAMLFLLICCAVFAGSYRAAFPFGYSFYLGWVAFIFNFFAAVTAIAGASYKIED